MAHGFTRRELRQLRENELLRRQAVGRVRALRATPWLIYAVTTGARGDLGKLLWQPPGASANILSDRFSYAQEETAGILGFRPEKFVTLPTACHMATAAYYQGRKLAVLRGLNENDVMGVGMTAGVTTGHERRGDDRVIVAIRTRHGIVTVGANLHKPENHATDAEAHRAMQGELADLITLDAILAAAGLAQLPLPVARIAACAELRGEGTLVPTPTRIRAWDPAGSFGQILWPDGRVGGVPDPATHFLFPGSFDVVTYAHDDMAWILRETTGKEPVFQITCGHPDKGGVPDEVVFRRAEQFDFRWPVLLLREEGLFVQKAERFPGVHMLVGADVVLKLFDPAHYGNSRAAMLRAMRRLEQLGTMFHVNGRECKDGVYRELSDIRMPVQRFGRMFRPFSKRMNVSSSARRAAGATL